MDSSMNRRTESSFDAKVETGLNCIAKLTKSNNSSEPVLKQAPSLIQLIPRRCDRLKPLEVRVVRRGDGIDHFQSQGSRVAPFQGFDVAVGEGEITSTIVPHRGKIHPFVALGRKAEMTVIDTVLMLV